MRALCPGAWELWSVGPGHCASSVPGASRGEGQLRLSAGTLLGRVGCVLQPCGKACLIRQGWYRGWSWLQSSPLPANLPCVWLSRHLLRVAANAGSHPRYTVLSGCT